jgi:hypothetical protein
VKNFATNGVEQHKDTGYLEPVIAMTCTISSKIDNPVPVAILNTKMWVFPLLMLNKDLVF